MTRPLRIGPALVGASLGALAGAAWAHLYGEPGAVTTAWLALGHAVLGGGAAFVADRMSRGATGAAPLAAWAASVGLPIGAGLLLAPLGRTAMLSALLVLSTLAIGVIGLLARSRPGLVVLAIAPLLLLAPAAFKTPPNRLPTAPALDIASNAPLARVAVIGIDGGDWQVIDPLLAAGELPHLASLIEHGVTGTLMSADPMFSPVVWTSIFTGTTPETHGLSGWHSSLSTNRRVPTLWDLVAGAHGRSVVANVPGTWPPQIAAGAMLSGFPLPQLVTSADARGGQFFGVVVSDAAREGSVPTIALEGGTASVPLGRSSLASRTALENAFIERALRKRWLGGEMTWLEIEVEADDRVRLGDQSLELPVGAWTRWQRIDLAGQPAFLRVRRLARHGFYVTPPFASPSDASAPAILAGDVAVEAIAPDGWYVVEGAGWKATADADLRGALFEHQTQIHDMQSRAMRALAKTDWQLLAMVYTLTDRVQHAFWPYHEPTAFTLPPTPSEIAGHGDKVNEAYRRVDAELGRLLALLPPDTTVVVVSDHGSAADPDAGFGGHRAEGIFVAAGRGIAHSAERTTLSIYDVTPTLLAGLGFPVAEDLAGSARVELFSDDVQIVHVPTYRDAASANDAPRDEIEGSTEEQLRALGYVE